MSGGRWIAEVKAAWTVEQTVRGLGYSLSGYGRFAPCPACQESRRKDEQRPCCRVVDRDRWTCNTCKLWGDALDLVALKHVREGGVFVSLSEAGKARVKEWFLAGGKAVAGVVQPEPEPERMDPRALRELLAESTPVRRTQRVDVGQWMRQRGLDLYPCPAWVLPPWSWGGWWQAPVPRSWTVDWPVVVPAYSGLGVVASVHGRNVSGQEKTSEGHPMTKTRWPSRVSSRGLLFADPWVAVPGLRSGDWDGVEGVLLVEGFTDYLTAAGELRAKGRRWAVLGMESGSASGLAVARLPDVPLVCAVHDDDAGDRYFDAAAEVLSEAHGRFLRRVRPTELASA